jgi:CheY-like chemotaxis protein
LNDITEQKTREEDRIRAGKMESLGTIAGGIAHDFNNILMVIQGNAELLRDFQKRKGNIANSADEILQSCRYAAGLTNQLLTFSKGGAPKKEVTSLLEILKDAASLCLSGKQHTSEFDIKGDLWSVEVDRCQISQVVSNLVLNAAQSMSKGGRLKICAENYRHEDDGSLDLAPGPYVCFSVKDEGPGIEESIRRRIFDPYFTTKKTGSGLGLAVVYAIIKKHQGLIRVDSIVGKGTTFHVYLPAVQDAKIKKENKACPTLNLAAGKKVLIMDDDESIRRVLAKSLKYIGCTVETAADGEGATSQFRTARDLGAPFDLVLLDLTIVGGKGGAETITEILKIDPSAKAVVVSGYSDDDMIAHFSQYGFKGKLKKPFTQKELRHTLNTVFSL